jgi:hypothetical protein
VLGDKMTDRTGKFISDKLLGWIFFIWLVVSFIGFVYTIFYIGNYYFTNVGYFVFWLIFINFIFSCIFCLSYAAEEQRISEE